MGLGYSCVPELGICQECEILKYSDKGKLISNLNPLINYGLAVTMKIGLKRCSNGVTFGCFEPWN